MVSEVSDLPVYCYSLRMAQVFAIPPPRPLQSEDWHTWIYEWKNFELAKGISGKDENVRVARYLVVLGRESYRIYETYYKTGIPPVMTRN